MLASTTKLDTFPLKLNADLNVPPRSGSAGASQTRSKRGSARRKGDEFQDLVALRTILELYISRSDFAVYLEYEKAAALDDIVVTQPGKVLGIQAKYSVDPLAVYVPDDFINTESRTYFGRFAAGWRKARHEFPSEIITLELVSNRGRDSQLEPIIGPDGRFTAAFIDGRIRNKPRQFREQLVSICDFEGDDAAAELKHFLASFVFRLREPSVSDLRRFIENDLLDHSLGVTDRGVFHTLKELVESHSIELHDPITSGLLDDIFRVAERRFLVPQVFPVDKQTFVDVAGFRVALRAELKSVISGYVVVTGLPGAGKSTALSEFVDDLEHDLELEVCRYFCFVGPQDSTARLRVEANAFRVNLLTELTRRFPEELGRRFDYSERNLIEALSLVGKKVNNDGKKLIILLDGLDHAERDQLVSETVLRALPTALPDGVVMVAGTQELKVWQPLALHEGRAHHHIAMPLFTLAETGAYLEKNGLVLEDHWIVEIHRKSQGLPLYLRYVVNWLGDHGSDVSTLSAMPEAVAGDIRDYYERLWQNFERDNMVNARYLCGVLAALRFSVSPQEIAEFQSVLSIAELPLAVRAIAHLLRDENGKVSVFHDSFRVFVRQKLDPSTSSQIARDISLKLRNERGSARWFGYVFEYALEADDADYVMSQVNREFVDFALQHCRPAEEIRSAIRCGGEAATQRKDLVQLARLGVLYFRTHERFEEFDYSMLARVQLELGRVEDVIEFSFRPSQRKWLVDDATALAVIEWCADTKHHELGQRLFRAFLSAHDNRFSGERHEVEAFAEVAAIFLEHPARFLRWLAEQKFTPDTLERQDLFAPEFEPHIVAFVRSCYKHGEPGAANRLKRIKRLLPNPLVRHTLLRLVARNGSAAELAAEVSDYITNTDVKHNLEVAAYAALAGWPLEQVKALGGTLSLPRSTVDSHSRGIEADFDRFQWSAIVLGYEGERAAIERTFRHIGDARTIYSGFLRFLLRVGICLGRAGAGNLETAFDDARAALAELRAAGTEDQPEEMETLRASRPMLPRVLRWLSAHVSSHCADQLDVWRDDLLTLRESEMWTSHWGITETRTDYRFELRIWDTIAKVTGMRSRLLPILRECASTYAAVRAFKGGERCQHFLWVAAIAARCGYRTEAEVWRAKGIAASLTYGYHKDTTLGNLINVLELLNPFEPNHGLSRTAEILELAKWMPAATDNRETKNFEQAAFAVILNTSREASFALIRYLREHTARWKMLDCLEQFCVAATGGNINVLWRLKDAFSAHYTDRGQHPKQVIAVASHFLELATSSRDASNADWKDRYSRFIRTHIDPLWWPEDIRYEVLKTEGWSPPRPKDPNQPPPFRNEHEFSIDGQTFSRPDIIGQLAQSLREFIQTAEKLRSQNDPLYVDRLIREAFAIQSVQITTASEALRLWEFASNSPDLTDAGALSTLSSKLLDAGENEKSYECLLAAYRRDTEYYWAGEPQGTKYLQELCARDVERVHSFFVERSQGAFASDYGGFALPVIIASFFAATRQVDQLRQVFEDYLQHCKELFAHLPNEQLYTWLKDFRDGDRDESREIVEFLIDILGESEIDQADRLLHALADLAKDEPVLICSAASARLATADSLLLDRLENLLDAVSTVCPRELAAYAASLIPFFSQPHFRRRSVFAEIVHRIHAHVPLAQEVLEVVGRATRPYSGIIAYPSRRFIIAEPSREFYEFLERGPLFDFRDRLRGVCNLLQIHPAIVLFDIERRLIESGWTLEKEKQQLKDDWRGQVHDKKVVWIVPTFHVRVSDLLQDFVHRAVENERYSAETVASIVNVLRLGDPKWIREVAYVKPPDVKMITVTDASAWIDEANSRVELVTQRLDKDGWSTLYEVDRFAQSDGWHPEFISELTVKSVLVPPEIAGESNRWPDADQWTADFECRSADENLTLDEASRRLRDAALPMVSSNGEAAPIIIRHFGGQMFVAMRCALSIHPRWLSGLEIRLPEILKDGSVVARVDQWQQGYEDEAYTRELLSIGIRLVARNDWLSEMLTKAGMALAISRMERREHRKHFWNEKPDLVAEQHSQQVLVP